MKYYVYDNASRRLKSGKFIYSFDVIEQFAGNWRGVMELSDPEAITALEAFGPRLGVREITLDEYLNYQKKNKSSWKVSPSIAHPQKSQAMENVGPVVVRENSNQTTLSVQPLSTKPAISDVVIVGEAPYVDPLEARSGGKKRKK